MLKIKAAQLHGIFQLFGEDNDISKVNEMFESYQEEIEEDLISKEDFLGLAHCDIEQICVGQGMSENHLGGDDLVEIADEVRDAIEDGYKVFTWYGPETEVLIIGYRPDELKIEA